MLQDDAHLLERSLLPKSGPNGAGISLAVLEIERQRRPRMPQATQLDMTPQSPMRKSPEDLAISKRFTSSDRGLERLRRRSNSQT